MITVVAPGPLATVQDQGRFGWAELGVGRAGAADRAALRLANRLVGNPVGAAGIEVTLGGLVIRLEDAATLALTGAPCPGSLGWGAAATLPAGTVIRLGTPDTGVRSYLAMRGGIDATVTLGSRSTDTMGGLGPGPLQAGDRLPVGAEPAGPVSGAVAAPRPEVAELRIVPGPRADWFAPKALQTLLSATWIIQPDSDRVGVRLDGPSLRRAVQRELPSEGTLPGAVQVPPDGRPILLGPDAPVTGGYPVLAVVRDADLDAAFQRRPGQTLRFALKAP
jgi:biotin-dependent carboxylase-like uncharacterized protein